MKKISINNLSVDENLYNFLNNEVLPGTDVDQGQFWDRFSKVVHKLQPENKALLKKREEIQKKLIIGTCPKKDQKLIKKNILNF